MKTKRIMAIILSAVLLFSSAAVYAAESEEAGAATVTVSRSAAQEAVDVLSGLDIIASTDSIPDGNITRGDFAQLLLSLLQSEYVQARDLGYRDVAGGSALYNAVGYLCELGAMSGSRGLFRPNEAITMQDAVRALVTVLGHTKAGASDAQCMNRAHALSLLDGITTVRDGAVSKAAAWRMAFNALFVEYSDATTLNSGQILYAAKGTVLERFYDITEVVGVVTQTKQTGLYTQDGCNGVCIDGLTCTAEKDWSTYLGYRVQAYVRDNGHRELVYMRPHRQNKVLTFETDDIERLENKTTLYYYTDAEQGRTAKLKLSSTTPVIVNGQNAGSVSNFSTNELILKNDAGQPLSAQMTVIDSDDDGTVNCIVIWRYETFYITKSDTAKGFFRDKYSNTSLNLDDYDEDSIYIYTDGESGSKTDLRVGVVLSIAKTADNSSITIYASTTQLYDETVSAVQDNKFKIGDTWYEKSDYYNTLFNGTDGTEKPHQIYAGTVGVFYLDHMGRVVFAKQSSGYQYGYLMAVKQESGLSDVYHGRVFAYDEALGESDFKDLIISPQLQINGATCKRSQFSSNTLLFSNGSLVPQLIKYKLNAKGELSQMLLADTSHTLTNLDFKLSDHWYATTEFELNYKGEARYNANALALGNRFYCGEDSMVMVVPSDVTDEDGYAFSEYSSVFSNSETYDVELYDVGRDTYSGMIVYRSDAGVSDTYSMVRTFYVSDVITTIDAEENQVQQVTGYSFESESWIKFRKSTYSYFTADDFKLVDKNGEEMGDIKKGDIVRYNKNAKGSWKSAELQFRYSEGAAAFRDEEATSGKTYNFAGDYGKGIYGQMAFYEAGQSVIGISFDAGRSFITYSKYGSDYTPYIVFDTKRGTTTLNADPDIVTCMQNPQEADWIYGLSIYGKLPFVVLYK